MHQDFYTVIKSVFPSVVCEYRFNPKRRWRADFAVPEEKILIEIEGGLWKYGRHNRTTGYTKDMEKYNSAQILGFKVLRYTPGQAGRCLDDCRSLTL